MSSEDIPAVSMPTMPTMPTLPTMPTMPSAPSIPGTGPLTSISNKIQYLISKSVSDPEAEAYAKQQAAQAVQDAAVQRQQVATAKTAAEAEAAATAEAEAAASLVTRSKFNSKQLVTQVSNGILLAVARIIALCFALYGGHIAVNQAIGYNVPFRLLTFFYGMICSIWIVPKALYDIYWKGIKLPYYSFLPISTYVPNGDLQNIFIGPFCYTKDSSAIAARAAVVALYSDAFKRSTGVAIKAATAVVAVAALANTSKGPNGPNALPKATPVTAPVK